MADISWAIICISVVTVCPLVALLRNGSKDLGLYVIGLALIIFGAGIFVILFLLSKVEFGLSAFFPSIIGFGMGLVTTKSNLMTLEGKNTPPKQRSNSGYREKNV
jgi:hypothetical protein